MAPKYDDGFRYRCSLVIPTKNGGELFRVMVDRLMSQTCWPEVEFIVIDSGSTDETVSIARSAGAVVFSIDATEFNHGSTRDHGISLSNSAYVILMVQDALPQDDVLIERLLSSLDDGRVAGVYARQIPQPTADVIQKRNLNSWFSGELRISEMRSLEWYRNLSPMAKYRLCNFDNVCSAINKGIWATEPFGPNNFGEDIDWAERVLKRGFKIVYDPSAVVIHSHDRSLGYNYERTYLAHRLLYRRFGLCVIPSLGALWWAWLRSSASDMLFVVRHEKRMTKKIRTLVTLPIANLVSGLSQYRAVRDETRGVLKNVSGI